MAGSTFASSEPSLQVQAPGEGEGNEREFAQLAQRLDLADLGVHHGQQQLEHECYLLWHIFAQGCSSGAHQRHQTDHVSVACLPLPSPVSLGVACLPTPPVLVTQFVA